MKNETTSESTDTSTVEGAPYPPEAQRFYEGTSERFYVFVVDSEESTHIDDWVGAVYINELTRSQYAIFKKKFSQAYRGQCVVGFFCQQPLSSDAERSLKIALSNYEFLTDDQKQALDVAYRVADQVRDADDCEGKNVRAKPTMTAFANTDMESTQEDIFDLFETKKGQGRWVSQNDFANPRINKKHYRLNTLKTYRETRYLKKSAKDPSIGMDKKGHFLQKEDEKTTSPYRYFLLREFDKGFTSDPDHRT